MLRLSDLRYAPDQTRLWDAAPGTVYEMWNFVPLPRGTYSAFGSFVWPGTAWTGTEQPIISYMHTLIDGTVRFLMATSAKIDEVSATGVRTNRGSGYTATTWSMAQYGNSTIATNGTDVVQVATGAASSFGALGGTPPKALIAVVQSNFVLLFNVSDGVTTAQDGWNCSGLGNSTSWTAVNILGGASTANLATQANNGRLLQAPGPIRAAVAFRDQVIVFKDNAIISMQYSGNPFGFTSRLVTNQVGCSSMHGIAEHRGKLYFWHPSGFYSFDGSSIQNIGDGAVNGTALSNLGYFSGVANAASLVNNCQAIADDSLCNVFFHFKYKFLSFTNASRYEAFVFNSVCNKWGKAEFLTVAELGVDGNDTSLVKATTSQLLLFNSVVSGRFPYWKYIAAGTVPTLNLGSYGLSTTNLNADGAYFRITFGARDSVKKITTVYFDYGTLVNGVATDANADMSLVITGGDSPSAPNGINSGATFAYNSTTYAHNGLVSGRFFDMLATTTDAVDIDAITLDVTGGGRQ